MNAFFTETILKTRQKLTLMGMMIENSLAEF